MAGAFKDDAEFARYPTRREAIEHVKECIKAIKTDTAAEAYLREHVPHEKHYQQLCRQTILDMYPGAFVWKAQAGGYATSGMPDLVACIEGRFFAFEIKRPYFGKLSLMQERRIEAIRKAGGKAYVVSFPHEVVAILREEFGG